MARTTGALRHVHRYMRTYPNIRRIEPIWKCTLDGCSHFIPYNDTVLGRACMCWGCGELFIMRDTNLNSDMPKCNNCENPVNHESMRERIATLWEQYRASTDEQERHRLTIEITLLQEQIEE